MIIRSKAPLRISFAGGGTEVEPYLSEQGGAVLSSTIDKYAYSSLRFKDDHQITVSSLDYDIVAKYDADTRCIEDKKLNLVEAVIRRLNPKLQHRRKHPSRTWPMAMTTLSPNRSHRCLIRALTGC